MRRPLALFRHSAGELPDDFSDQTGLAITASRLCGDGITQAMKKSLKPRVLYVVYWGAAEPLGQSLVLPAVKRLAGLGAELTLVTFEKPADLDRKEEMARIKNSLDGHGIEWMPLRYHKR